MAGAMERATGMMQALGRVLRKAVRWISRRLAPFQRLLRPAEKLIKKPYGVVGPLAVALAAGVVLGQLGAVLAGLHIPGAGSYTITDLTDTGFRLPSADRAADVIRTWQEVPIAEGYRGPKTSIWSFAIVDFALFAPAYALLLAVTLLKLRGSLETAGEPGNLEQTALRRLRRRGAEPTEEQQLLDDERATIDTFRRADLGLVKFALLLVPVLFLLDEAENVLIPIVYHAGPDGSGFTWLFALLAAAAWLKWAVGIVLVISLLVVTLAAASLAPDRVGRLWTALVVLRPQLLLLAFYAAGVFAVEQSADVVLRWSEDPRDAVAAVALTACFGAVALASARLLLEELGPPEKKVPERNLIVAGVVLLVAAAVGELGWGFGLGLAVPGVLLLVVVGLSALAGQPPVRRHVRDVGRFAQVLPALLGGLPLVLLGLAALRTSVPEVAYAANDGFLVLAGIGLAVMAVGWVVVLRQKPRLKLRELKILLRVALVGSFLLALRVYLNPWRISEALGSIGVFAGFTVGATLIAFGLVYLAEKYEPPSVFSLLRLRRTPVFVLLAIWALAAAKIDPNGAYYDVRTLPQSKQAAAMSRQSIVFDRTDPGRRDAFDEWAARRPKRQAVPLVFVAAAGGGVRASYWVATVLDCVLEGRGNEPACNKYGDVANQRAEGSVFAASGISGGSVGLAAYATHLRYRPEDTAWREDRLGDDYIAPMIGWALFVDAPLAFIRRDGGEDRAAILERAFERSWVDDIGDRGTAGFFWKRGTKTDSSPLAAGIFDLWARRQRPDEPRLPLLLLNGTKVQDGCRLNGSVFDASVEYQRREDVRPAVALLAEDCLALRLFEATPAEEEESIYVKPAQRAQWTFASTEDLSDFVCAKDDVRLSTAAILSARFPFALPSGRLAKCRTPGSAINVVDGGYFDTSGASPLVELWTELEPEVDILNGDPDAPCIVPFFLQIDTGYSDPTSGSQARPLEATVPLATAKSARNAREANARQAAALAFSGPFGRVAAASANGMEIDRFAHIYPRAHPGSKAPLGWTLSRTARRDLDRQLSVNSAEIAKVRDWFNATLQCDREP